MDSQPAPAPDGQSAGLPQAEELKPRTEGGVTANPPPNSQTQKPVDKKLKKRTFRPSHKATFIGIGVVVLILAVNVGGIVYILKKQSKSNKQANISQVSLSSDALSKLGVNNSTAGSGVLLTVGPDAQFKGTVTVAGATTVGGQLSLNGQLTGTAATLTTLQAGNTTVTQLNVNGDGTVSNLNLRNNLDVVGITRLQGSVTINSAADIGGNLVVGGTLSVGSFSAKSLTSTSAFTVDGHVITGGSAPNAGRGGAALGSNGTVSISGDDSAGVININIGTGAVGGTLVNVSFATQFSSVPHVVVTPVGVGANFYLINMTVGGFSVGVTSGLPAGGYSLEYIVEQ